MSAKVEKSGTEVTGTVKNTETKPNHIDLKPIQDGCDRIQSLSDLIYPTDSNRVKDGFKELIVALSRQMAEESIGETRRA